MWVVCPAAVCYLDFAILISSEAALINKIRQLTELELAEHERLSLETISRLCEIYDAGHPYIAFTLAADTYRFLTESSNTKQRGTKQFITFTPPHRKTNLLCEHKLTTANVRGDTQGWYLEFVPTIFSKPLPYPTKLLTFRDWWNRDIIYRASAAPPGTNPSIVPLDPNLQIPYEKRRRFVRREFVQLMRNKFGAHLDKEVPELLDTLQRSESFGVGLTVNLPSGPVNSLDGTLRTRVGPGAGIMREIAEEVLIAYGIRAAPSDARSS